MAFWEGLQKMQNPNILPLKSFLIKKNVLTLKFRQHHFIYWAHTLCHVSWLVLLCTLYQGSANTAQQTESSPLPVNKVLLKWFWVLLMTTSVLQLQSWVVETVETVWPEKLECVLSGPLQKIFADLYSISFNLARILRDKCGVSHFKVK